MVICLCDVAVDLCHRASPEFQCGEGSWSHQRPQPYKTGRCTNQWMGQRQACCSGHHCDIPSLPWPSWASHVTRLVQQPMQQRPGSTTPMDPNARSWAASAFPWQWRPMGNCGREAQDTISRLTWLFTSSPPSQLLWPRSMVAQHYPGPLYQQNYPGQGAPTLLTAFVSIWDNVQQNHPCDTFSNFQDKQKKSNAHIEMYG